MADASFGTPSINPFGLSPTGGYSRPVFVDIDADGDLDAFVGLGNGTTQFLRNAGSAREPAFTIEGSNFGIASIGTFASPTFGDLDGDGDLDAVVGAQSGQTQVFLNTGTAAAPAFGTATALVPSMASATTPLLIDIDGDADLDLFVGSSSGTVRFFRNTGTPVAATFSDEGNPFLIPAVSNYPALGAADVDEDLRPLSVDRVEWEHIQRVLSEHDGNISATARALGMHRRTLQRKLGKNPPRN